MKNFPVTLSVILLLFIFSFSCKKTETDRKVHGQIIDTIANAPIANTPFVLYVINDRILKPTEYIPFTFTTDDNGSFKVICHSNGNGDFEITWPDNTQAGFYGGNLYDKMDVDVGTLKTTRP